MGGCISRKKSQNSPGIRRATAPNEFPNFAHISTPHNNGLMKHILAKIANNTLWQRNSSSTTNKANEENRNPDSIAPVAYPRIKSSWDPDKITTFNKLENSQLDKKQSNATDRNNSHKCVEYAHATIVYHGGQRDYISSNNSDSFMKPRLVHENNFVESLYKQPLQTFKKWSVEGIFNCSGLEFGTPAYNKIRNKFAETGKRSMDILSISQIINPYIQMLYKLKKSEMESRMNVTEKLLFHGTTQDRIESICSNNFDHRLSGTVTGSKFGKGMSFSPISFYASHYCDKKSKVKVMLLCKVLVGNSHFGNKFTYIPDEGFDTTTNHNRHVIVKYDDDVYCPEYLITFMFN